MNPRAQRAPQLRQYSSLLRLRRECTGSSPVSTISEHSSAPGQRCSPSWSGCSSPDSRRGCDRPLVAGVLTGLAVLFNAAVLPGIAIVSAVLIFTSGATRSQTIRWVATTGASALAVCAWWLIPFLAGWSRLVRDDVPLSEAWTFGGGWQLAVLVTLGVGTVWVSLKSGGTSQRLGLAAGAALVATILADLLGYHRSESWLELPVLVAVVSIAAAVNPQSRHSSPRPIRPSLVVIVALITLLLVAVVGRWEFLPLGVWALTGLKPRIWGLGRCGGVEPDADVGSGLADNPQPSRAPPRLRLSWRPSTTRAAPTQTEPSTSTASTTPRQETERPAPGTARGEPPHSPKAGSEP